LLRDRDGIYESSFQHRVHNLGIEELVIAWRSPWQSPYVERVIGTLRRELLDHVIVMNERHLQRLLRSCVSGYSHSCRTHLSLDKDAPEPRPVKRSELGEVVEPPVVGGLHHRYTRRAA
jgi:putative transposase